MTSFPTTQSPPVGRRNSDRLARATACFAWKRFADGYELPAYFFAPEGHHALRHVPGVLFYPGGMFCACMPEVIVPWALQIASRGIACVVPVGRDRTAYDADVEEIVEEGVEAWHWLHGCAPQLGIDPGCITLAGTDSGGLSALYAAMQPIIKKKRWWQIGRRDVLPLSPAAVAIFRGVVDVEAPESWPLHIVEEATDPGALNPSALLRRRLPPLFCVHGTEDPLMDFELREWFCKEWKRYGNKVECLLCPGADHTLTSFEVNPALFEHIFLCWEEFMVRHSLWPEESVDEARLV